MKLTPVLVEQGTPFAGKGYEVFCILFGASPNALAANVIVHAIKSIVPISEGKLWLLVVRGKLPKRVCNHS
jgi:hypothetical protein